MDELNQLSNSLQPQEQVARVVLEPLSQMTPDTLRFLKNYVGRTHKDSLKLLLESKEEIREITFPDRVLVINLQQLRELPMLRDLAGDEVMSKLSGVSVEEYKVNQSKHIKTQVENVIEISMFISALATELMLFVPQNMNKPINLVDKPVTTVFDLNVDILNLITEPMFVSKHFGDEFKNCSIKLQTAIVDTFANEELCFQKLITEVSPHLGLNQRIPLSETGGRRDVILVEKDSTTAKKFVKDFQNLLSLTRLFLSVDYTADKLTHYDEIINSLTNDKLNLYIVAKPVQTVMPLKVELEVKYVSHTEAFQELTKNLDESMYEASYGAIQVRFYDWTSGGCEDDGQGNQICSTKIELSYEMAVEYFETIQGYEKGYVDQMVSYAKQMFRAYQAVMSLEYDSDVTTESSIHDKVITLHNVHSDRLSGFNAQVYRFAVPVYYTQDRQLDEVAIKAKENLKMVNPYIQVINR